MLKRSPALLITLALLTASGSSFAQPAAPKDNVPHFREYEPEDKSFKILYPADWKVVPGTSGPTVVSFFNPASQTGKPPESTTLSIVSTKGSTLDRIAQGMKEAMAAKPGFTLVEDSPFTVGTWKTHRFVFDTKAANNIAVRGIQFLLVRDQSAYVMTFYMPPEKFNKEAEDRAFQLCGLFKVGGDEPAAKTDKASPFESKEFGFAMTYPPSWNKQALDQKGVALALAKRASAGKVPQILMVMADTLEADEKADLKDMEAKLVESSKGSLKDGKVMEAVDSKLGGEPARRIILGGLRKADDHQGRVILTFCIRGRSTFGLMAGGPIEDFDGVKTDVDKIIASFTFDKTGAAAATPATPSETKPPIKPVAAAATIFDSPALGVKLTYPPTWTLRKSTDATVPMMLFSTPTRPGSRPNTIVITTEPVAPGTRTTLKEQSDSMLAGLKVSVPDAKVMESLDVKVGNEKGRRMLIGGHATVGKVEMRSVSLMFQHGSEAITLSGQSPAEDYASLKEAFDSIVASIELAVPTPKRGQ